jgi:hypothetical protein
VPGYGRIDGHYGMKLATGENHDLHREAGMERVITPGTLTVRTLPAEAGPGRCP